MDIDKGATKFVCKCGCEDFNVYTVPMPYLYTDYIIQCKKCSNTIRIEDGGHRGI
jgi:hypothetical protein